MIVYYILIDNLGDLVKVFYNFFKNFESFYLLRGVVCFR